VYVQQSSGAVYWDAKGLYNISGGCSNVADQPTVSFQRGGGGAADHHLKSPSLRIIIVPPGLLLAVSEMQTHTGIRFACSLYPTNH